MRTYGIIFALVAAILFAIIYVITRVLQKVHFTIIGFYYSSFGTVFYSLLGFVVYYGGFIEEWPWHSVRVYMFAIIGGFLNAVTQSAMIKGYQI